MVLICGRYATLRATGLGPQALVLRPAPAARQGDGAGQRYVALYDFDPSARLRSLSGLRAAKDARSPWLASGKQHSRSLIGDFRPLLRGPPAHLT